MGKFKDLLNSFKKVSCIKTNLRLVTELYESQTQEAMAVVSRLSNTKQHFENVLHGHFILLFVLLILCKVVKPHVPKEKKNIS